LARRVQKKVNSGDDVFTDKKERGSLVRSRIPELDEKEVTSENNSIQYKENNYLGKFYVYLNY